MPDAVVQMALATAAPLALLVALMWGLQPVLHKRILRTTSPQVIMAVGSAFYFACMLVFVAFNWTSLRAAVGVLDGPTVALIGVTTVMTAFVANLIYLYVLKDHKSYVVSALIYSSPLFTLLIATALGGERVGAAGVAGVLLIVAGVLVLAAKG